MSVAKMKKILAATQQNEAAALLDAVQSYGLMQISDAQHAIISKHHPDLLTKMHRPKDEEEKYARYEAAVSFLSQYEPKKTLADALRPKIEINQEFYQKQITTENSRKLLEDTELLIGKLNKLKEQKEHLNAQLHTLQPWEKLDFELDQLDKFEKVAVITGLLPIKNLPAAKEKIAELETDIEQIGTKNGMLSCVIIALKQNTSDIYKALRACEFESVNLTGFKGKAAELIKKISLQIKENASQTEQVNAEAEKLAQKNSELKILADYYGNLLNREKTRLTAPETEKTALLEGWIKEKDLPRLNRIAEQFAGTTIIEIEPEKDEAIPMEIENNKLVRPFETITRLHGMPNVGDVDPTVFLAPFFAIFFGLCLTDAGYGLIMLAAFWWLIKKFQGDKKAFWMFIACSACTVVAGALTGGWFGDTFQTLLPQGTGIYKALNGLRDKTMLFDPMKDPMKFFIISIALGYIQIMFALFIGLCNNIIKKDFATAFFNFLVWIIFLNSLALFGAAKGGFLPAAVGKIAGWTAIVQAVLIFLFTERSSGMAGRIGGGFFSLFSTVFYFGDILSYVRLMALGMVTAGLGMAVNILVKLLMDIPYIGFVLGALLFVGGHLMNLALSVLSSFVHSLRLQFVEFFPKFFTGGGREFKPLTLNFKHLLIKENTEAN